MLKDSLQLTFKSSLLLYVSDKCSQWHLCREIFVLYSFFPHRVTHHTNLSVWNNKATHQQFPIPHFVRYEHKNRTLLLTSILIIKISNILLVSKSTYLPNTGGECVCGQIFMRHRGKAMKWGHAETRNSRRVTGKTKNKGKVVPVHAIRA
jgi:hypothetical protein